MISLKFTSVGNSTRVVLPQDLLERLQVDRGDLLYVVETPSDPELAQQKETAERVMREDRDVLRKLAE